MNVSVGLAFIAGLASFLSPCVLSLVPAYISYLSGRSAAAVQSEKGANRWQTLLHGLAFVLGFTVIFMSLGFGASAIGQIFGTLRPLLTRIGGVVVILFGIHMTGIFRIPFLEYELRPQFKADRNQGYISSFLMGIFFSAGWSPCVGPVLGFILTLAFQTGEIYNGLFLLAAYSAGLAIPFLLAALGIGWVTQILRKYNKVMHYVEIGMGVILIIIGSLLLLGMFEQIFKTMQANLFFDFGL
jgi:cytochrome c-type biogenesis protein